MCLKNTPERSSAMGLHDALFAASLGHLCDVERATESLQDVGGKKKTYAAHLFDVPCRAAALPILQREIAKLRIKFDPDADIEEDDHVLNIRYAATGATAFSGTYRVKFAGDPTGAGHHKIVDVVELSD